ncbi:MAG: hypothetical protein H7333_10400 [Bdellovibrionales bacterium]|nr:hypothetical protein [Oligoflexia bacterium]
MTSLNPNDYFNTLLQHKKRILNCIGVCTLLALGSYFVLPKTYKVSSMISLQTQYFQLPLVSGFLPETMDPQELKAKREALLHLAMNQQFLSQMATRYKLIKDPTNSHDLELLAKKLEIIPNGSSAFIVNFTAKDPNVAYQVLQEFISHLQSIMTTERHTLLLNLHDAIQEQLETIAFGKPGDTPNAIYAARPDLVQQRMDKIQSEIATLKASYSEKHPRITALKDQLTQLAQFNKPFSDSSPPAAKGDMFGGIKVDGASKELFDDLLKKYRYLEVVIFMDQQNKDHYMSLLNEAYIPESPVFPKLPILIVWGIAAGFLLGSIWVLMKEMPVAEEKKRFTVVPSRKPVRIEEEA